MPGEGQRNRSCLTWFFVNSPTEAEESTLDGGIVISSEREVLSEDSRSRRSKSSDLSSRGLIENPSPTPSPSCDQGERCSEDVASAISRLADPSILRQKVSELNWGTSQTNRRNSYENFVLESNSMQPDGRCSSSSDLSIAEQPFVLTAEVNST